jgi:hypothetical protein
LDRHFNTEINSKTEALEYYRAEVRAGTFSPGAEG